MVNKCFHSSYIQREFNDEKEIIINIFSAYVVPLLKYINNPALLQERKLNLDAALYEINIDANMSKPSDKKEIDCHDSDLYWPTKTKYTIQWFPFLSIMEHTANILNPKQGIITSLLKVFTMFGLSLIDDRDKVQSISIRCINCKKETGLYLGTSTLEEIITNFC